MKEIEHESLSLLQEHCISADRKIVNTNSTGKDSMVVHHLVKKAGVSCETYFNVTTLDVAESNQMAKRNGFKHIYPDPQHGGFTSMFMIVGLFQQDLHDFVVHTLKKNQP